MQDQITTMQDQTTTMQDQENELKSPFEAVKDMNDLKAFNILVQAANAAQRAGVFGFSDSVFITKAIELLGDKFNNK